MLSELLKKLALDKITDILTAKKEVSPVAQHSINQWAGERFGKVAFSGDGGLQSGFVVRGWSVDKRYFWLDYYEGGKKAEATKWSNVTGQQKG